MGPRLVIRTLTRTTLVSWELLVKDGRKKRFVVRVLMLGWEFPPHIGGGLGTACHGLSKALNLGGTDILFLLPRTGSEQPFSRPLEQSGSAVLDLTPELPGVRFRAVPSRLVSPYVGLAPCKAPSPSNTHSNQVVAEASGAYAGPRSTGDYGDDLFAEVERYAHACLNLTRDEEFDVVHAHDWMTYPAGLAVSRQSGKPLVAHLHSTEFDRSGEKAQRRICEIERRGLCEASAVICVSRMTAHVAATRYSVAAERIVVVHNGIEVASKERPSARIKPNDKIVLFLGRLTMQKGPEYFLAAAKKVLTVMDDVKFVVAGDGDLFQSTVDRATGLGIARKVHFTGFLRGDEVKRAFRMADLYVMPSVSEPFGIAPLEAISHGVPVIITKNSGVSEVLNHALKVDPWDIEEMANKIVAVLRHPALASTLRANATSEIGAMKWDKAAGECFEVYRHVCEATAPEVPRSSLAACEA